MNILKVFKKKDSASMSFADISSENRKKIVKSAIEKANKEQHDLVKAYRRSKCVAHN